MATLIGPEVTRPETSRVGGVRLLDAGATLIGKTITDEVSLGTWGNASTARRSIRRARDACPAARRQGRLRRCAGLATPRWHHTGGSVRVPASFAGCTPVTTA
jgi:amidase